MKSFRTLFIGAVFLLPFYACNIDTSVKTDKEGENIVYELDVDSDIVDVDLDISVPIDKKD